MTDDLTKPIDIPALFAALAKVAADTSAQQEAALAVS